MSTMDSGTGMAGARCAIHPALGATGTCARCGNFMCDTCSEYGTERFCPVCRARTSTGAFPLRRDTWSFSALWDYCFAAFKREWLMLSLAVLVMMAVSVAAQVLGNVVTVIAGVADSVALIALFSILAFLLQTVVQGVMGMGLVRVAFDVLEGGRADVGRLFSQVHKAGRYLASVLLAMVVLVVPLMLLFALVMVIGVVVAGVPLGDLSEQMTQPEGPRVVGAVSVAVLLVLVPAIYFGLPLYLLQPELTFTEGGTAMEALRHCYTLARGERLSLFGMGLVIGLVVIVGLLACCVGILPALGLGQLLVSGLYLALRNGSSLDVRPR